MEELINEVESLYKQIYEIQLDMSKSRLDVCNELTWKAISDMETAMCDTQKILNCIIDRKNNIVDLVEVWHSADEEPTYGDKLLCDDNCMGWSVRAWDGMLPWSEHVKLYGLTKWAYIKDLFPKGGE